MINAGIHDKIGSSFNGLSGGLHNWAESGITERERGRYGYEKKTEKEYNSSVRTPKAFDGNLKLFSESSFQYNKRFPKNSCCGIVKATEKDIVENPERLIKTENAVFIDNMIEWKTAKGKVYICAECGHIVESLSEVQKEEQKEKSMLSKSDQMLFHGRIIEEKDEYEPTPEEIAEAAKSMGL